MNFRVTGPAERDLEEIADYIALDNRGRALSFVAEIESRFIEIAAHPGLYRLRSELMPGMRAAVHGNYLIYFSCEDGGEVSFLRVLHGARDQAGLFSDT